MTDNVDNEDMAELLGPELHRIVQAQPNAQLRAFWLFWLLHDDTTLVSGSSECPAWQLNTMVANLKSAGYTITAIELA